jgi:hypothetical protein
MLKNRRSAKAARQRSAADKEARKASMQRRQPGQSSSKA